MRISFLTVAEMEKGESGQFFGFAKNIHQTNFSLSDLVIPRMIPAPIVSSSVILIPGCEKPDIRW